MCQYLQKSQHIFYLVISCFTLSFIFCFTVKLSDDSKPSSILKRKAFFESPKIRTGIKDDAGDYVLKRNHPGTIFEGLCGFWRGKLSKIEKQLITANNL